MIGLKPDFARRRSLSSRSESVPCVTVTSLTVAPNAFLALSRPAAAESLNDLSPRPPMSYAIAAFTLVAAFAVGATSAPAARVAAATSAAMRIDFFNFPPRGPGSMFNT